MLASQKVQAFHRLRQPEPFFWHQQGEGRAGVLKFSIKSGKTQILQQTDTSKEI